MPSDALVTVPGSGAAPQTYSIAAAQEIILKAAFAVFDGTSAASTWLPCLRILSPSGQVVGEYVTPTTVAAGASAEVSWAPFLKPLTAPPAVPSNPTGTVWAWFDFSDTSTITADGSGNITIIEDKTGNGHDCSQTVASQRPSQTTINGLNAAHFNRANFQALAGGPFTDTLPQPFTIACVWTLNVAATATNWPGPFGGHGPPPNPNHFVNDSNTLFVAQQGALSMTRAGGGPFTQNCFTIIYHGATSVFRINGAQTVGNVSTGVVSQIAIGAQTYPTNVGENDHLLGEVCELIYYYGHLATAQITGVEAYLKAKWATP